MLVTITEDGRCALPVSFPCATGTHIIIIITRWASKRQSHSMEYYDKDTLRHDSLTSLQASLQVGPVTASQTEAQNRYQASSNRLIGRSPRASVHAAPCKPFSSPPQA
jgi:hypothetical protein